jgi:very-short-patch-repair endonuclease
MSETHGTEEEVAHDRRRDAYLQSQGWRVLRIPNIAVYENLHHVVELILSHVPPSASLAKRSLGTSPASGGG